MCDSCVGSLGQFWGVAFLPSTPIAINLDKKELIKRAAFSRNHPLSWWPGRAVSGHHPLVLQIGSHTCTVCTSMHWTTALGCTKVYSAVQGGGETLYRAKVYCTKVYSAHVQSSVLRCTWLQHLGVLRYTQLYKAEGRLYTGLRYTVLRYTQLYKVEGTLYTGLSNHQWSSDTDMGGGSSYAWTPGSQVICKFEKCSHLTPSICWGLFWKEYDGDCDGWSNPLGTQRK